MRSQDMRPNDAPTSRDTDISIISALRTSSRATLSNRNRSLSEHAQVLGISPARLTSSLKQQDTTLAREIKRLRIDVAKEMFSDPAHNVASVAEALGYTDQSHFARFFRSQTGLSPREYRRTVKSE